MSYSVWMIRTLTRPGMGLSLAVVLSVTLAGCASMTEDVDAYYRQMAYNWRESGEKAKMDELSLDSESKVLAATGDFRHQKRVKRELDKVKAWEEKCDKQAGRFEKAAKWTETRFHLTRPAIPDGPPSLGKSEDDAVLQASGAKAP
jgi:outer membrane murein-binding lipoprotein Lpp